MKRRLLSLLLVLSMCMSMCVVCAGTASAADGSAAEGYVLASAVYDYGYGEYSIYTYTYDSNGNILTEYGCNYYWDDEESDVYLARTSTTTYTYDSNGNLLTETWVCSHAPYVLPYIITYTYDSDGRLLSSEQVYYDADTDTYGYDVEASDFPDKYKVADYYGSTTTYTYDDNGSLLTKTEVEVDGDIYTYTYDSVGNLLTKAYDYGDGIYTYKYTYDSYNNLLTEERITANGTSTTAYSYTYTYDSDGNVLTKVSSSGTTYTYAYDSVGNRVSEVISSGVTYTYTYISLAELQGETEEEEIENPFTDVQNASSWYYNAVMWAVEKGITNGTTDTTFSPTQDCTRAEIVTFLWRAAGSPEPETTENPFTDVASNRYYYKAVLWAVEKGITTGTSSTTFSPNASCTRAEAVTFIYRYAGSPSVSATDKFTDVSSSKWYTSAVAWAVENSITSGTSSTTFSPDTTCSRAMIVTFLYRNCA